jgi:hypothetical protein
MGLKTARCRSARRKTPMNSLRTSASLAFCVAALSGCSLLIDVDRDQCGQDSDCASVGFAATCEQGVCVRREQAAPAECDGGPCESSGDAGELPGDAGGTVAALGASCAQDVRCEESATCFKEQCALAAEVERFMCEPQAAAPVVATVRFTMPVRDFVSEAALPELVVLACQESDLGCDSPIARFDDPDATGDVVLDLPYAFTGYLDVRSPAVLPSLWYFTKPLVSPTDAKVLKAVSRQTVQLLASITAIEVDASKGLVILEAFDCAKTAAGGIHFEESKRAAIPFFIIDGRPNVESTITVYNELDNQAAGGFINATPGFTIFSARIGIDGPVLGSFNANVRANTVTYLDIHP